MRWPLPILVASLLLPGLSAQDPSQRRPGLQEDGSSLLPNGWLLTPVGPQVEVSTLPMAVAPVGSSGQALVLSGGFLPPSVSVVDVDTAAESQRIVLPDGWRGLVVHPDGSKAYVSGGAGGQVHFLEKSERKWALSGSYPTGRDAEPSPFVGDLALSPDARTLYAAHLFDDRVSMLNARSGYWIKSFAVGPRPSRVLPLPGGEFVLVSHWGAATVGLYRVPEGRLIETINTGSQPVDMVWLDRPLTPEADDEIPLAGRLFVACANTNSVMVFGATAGMRFRELERVDVALSADAPAGSTPLALDLSADGNRLYVALANNNAVVVADVSGERTPLVGAIPTGWYPTDVAALPGGGLLYLSGKGFGTQPEPLGPNPLDRGRPGRYVAASQTGSVGILPQFDDEVFADLTAQVIANAASPDAAARPAGNPIPPNAGERSPIRNVVWVVVENRTYDQVFGDLNQGLGRADLAVFGEEVTPNYHALAERFVLFDNFSAAGDVSVDGWSWLAGGMGSPFVELLWPASYAGRLAQPPWVGDRNLARPPAGFLWDQMADAKLSYALYGVEGWLAGPGSPGAPAAVDPGGSDTERVTGFLEDFSRKQAAGAVPRLSVVALPGSHTAGGAAGYRTASASMAEHDRALGTLVSGLSRSKAWPELAVFVTSDDAQDGADHLDSHRAVALLASPYARRGLTDSTQYSVLSVLRTIELLLGLRPMTQFDAGAEPLWRAFRSEPDLKPFEAHEARIDTEERAPGSPAGQPRRVSAPAGVSAR